MRSNAQLNSKQDTPKNIKYALDASISSSPQVGFTTGGDATRIRRLEKAKCVNNGIQSDQSVLIDSISAVIKWQTSTAR